MKSFAIISALAGAVVASSAIGAPLESRNIGSSSTCNGAIETNGYYVKAANANDGAQNAYVYAAAVDHYSSALHTMDASHDNTQATRFGFTKCDAAGFTQGYSRNHGGSMGAPTEYWGRVSANVTNSANANPSDWKIQCLAAQADIPVYTQPDVHFGFKFVECNDQDQTQWFRLQETATGEQVIDYFPYKNSTAFKYNGQTPLKFWLDGYIGDRTSFVHYSPDPAGIYMKFSQ